jgi:hypothetical protein
MKVRGHFATAEPEVESVSPQLGREALLRLAEEASELELRGGEVLDGVRAGGSAAVLGPQGRAIAARFVEMRYELPGVDEPRLRHCADLLDVIFDQHTVLIHWALAFLVASQVSEQYEKHRRNVSGFGATSEWLALLVAALRYDRFELVDTLPRIDRRSPIPF